MLDKGYFESLKLETVRDRFYRAEDIDALLRDIRVRAENQASDNRTLEQKLREANARLEELTGEKAQLRRNENYLVDEAKYRAEEMLRETREAAAEQEKVLNQKQAEAAGKLETMFARLIEQQRQGIDGLNTLKKTMMEKLCPAAESTEDRTDEAGEDEESVIPEFPDDLGDKISFIAKEIREIGADAGTEEGGRSDDGWQRFV